MSASHVIALLLAFSGAELAAEAPAADPGASTSAAKADDAAAPAKTERTICKSVEVLGSRLKANKVCMTSSEWAEQRRLDRMSVDRAQRERGTQGN